MIQTTFNELVAAFLWGVFLLVSGLALGGWWRRRSRYQKERRHLVMCRLCHELFVDANSTPLATCPHCDALNERRGPRQL